ncbi:MAG: adenosine deaminase [Pseudomonadota bacterium]
MTNWRDFPKLELHCHLEGAAPPDLVRRLGAEQGIDLSGLFDAKGQYRSSDFTSFLQAYELVSKVFAKPETYQALTEAVLAEQAANGVVYTEIFLSPTSLGYDAAEWEEMLAAIEAGADTAEATHGIICRFIPVIIRHHGPDKATEATKVMLGARRGRMTGFGMAGDERQYHCQDFAGAFAAMAEAGFRLTAHAGEWGGPESVRAALDALDVERIGHGVRAAEDADLVTRLAEERIVLETCPGSNVALGVYAELAKHPIGRLAEAGCAVTVSTDDPPFFHTTMAREYENLASTFGMGAPDFHRFAATALDAAFCDAETKARIAARLSHKGNEYV